MKLISLTDEQYDILISELNSLYAYHWNNDKIHADDCGSKVVGIIEQSVINQMNPIGSTWLREIKFDGQD